MTRMIKRAAMLFVVLVAITSSACAQSNPMDRTAEVKAMLMRELPLGTPRDTVVARLDSLRIPHTSLDSARVRALVRKTSRSPVAEGSLQVILTFGGDGKLQRRDFKELFVAP